MSAPYIGRLAFVSLLVFWFAVAATPAAEEGKAAEKKPTETVDRYAVPEGDAAALLKFIDDLRAFHPATLDEAREHRQKSQAALQTAAEKVLTIEKDPKSEAYQKAKSLVLQLRIHSLSAAAPEEQKRFLGEVKEWLAQKGELVPSDLGLAFMTATTLQQSADKDLAVDALTSFGNLFKASKNEQFASYGDMMLGAVRRLNLLGNEMQIEGKTVDGKPFDWKSYRGKVVLVDFWATWCGPCVAELPNVKRNYELYKDKGFDVVAISLDRDRSALEAFLKEQQVPWVCLYEDSKNGQHPAAIYYGVMAIPTVILVDRDGKAVNLHARGEQLGAELARLLGPATPSPAPEKPATP
jgi:thiol-disulfide isomerase/thioredoxin